MTQLFNGVKKKWVGFLMLFCRFVLFSLLWVGNFGGYGDCLVVGAKKI